MILKGQNFRILIYDSTASKYKVVGLSTSATITLNTESDNATTKDDVAMAAKPTIISKSWQVSVDSLNVSDAGAMLTAIKSLTPFTLMWDETSTTDNQSVEGEAFARTGQAFLTDVTFNWNDRENSTKSLQFTGTGELSKVTTTPATEVIPIGTYTKGQFVRLYLGSDNTATPTSVVASSRQLSLHVSQAVENSTTKDTPGDYQIQEPMELSYDISTTALVKSGETITSAVGGQTLADIQDIYEASNPVKWQIANVSGDNQRTKGNVIASGSVVITTLTINNPNRNVSDYTAQLSGYGIYTVGA